MSAATFQHGLRKDWTTASGLRAVVLMTSRGHHCGYVAVPTGHPLHGQEYSTPCDALAAPVDGTPVGKRGPIALLAASIDADRMRSPEIVFDVHGGLTYSGGDGGYPAEGSGLWWFGFDCAHSGDRPSDEYLESLSEERRYWEERTDGVYRTLDYCVAECESLASQIVSATRAAS